jgi:hypothetical protein
MDDMRTCQVHPGQADGFLALCHEHGLPTLLPYLVSQDGVFLNATAFSRLQ